MKVQIEIDVPDDLKKKVEQVCGHPVDAQAFCFWLENECEYFINWNHTEFEKGFEDSVLHYFS